MAHYSGVQEIIEDCPLGITDLWATEHVCQRALGGDCENKECGYYDD